MDGLVIPASENLHMNRPRGTPVLSPQYLDEQTLGRREHRAAGGAGDAEKERGIYTAVV